MKKSSILCCIILPLCLISVRASAQDLTADYQFGGSRSSSVGTPPLLTETGSGQSYINEAVRGVMRQVLQFPQGDGLTLTPTTDVLSNHGVYTIALLFRFDSDTGFRRIIDFKNNTEDDGLYYNNGDLGFFPYTESTIKVAANTYALIVLTRDASGILKGYVNGVLAFAADDSTNQYGVIDSNNKLIFFKDDGMSEESGGAVSRIRIWNGALSGDRISALSGLTIFKIDSLTKNNAQSIDATPQSGDDRGGIAASKSKIFLTGDSDTGIWNRDDLSSPSQVGARREAMVANLHSQIVYTLADSGGSPIGISGGTVAKLVMLDPDTGALTATVIDLSDPITLSTSDEHVGIFSGWDRVVLVDGANAIAETVYNIDIPSGVVTNMGTIVSDGTFYGTRSSAESWADWGVAEFFDGSVHIVYLEGDVFPYSKIYRTDVSSGAEELVTDLAPFDFSDGHEFTVVPTLNRWYFHFECCGNNQIVPSPNDDETLGFADAKFTIKENVLYAGDGSGQNPNAHLFLLNPDDGSVVQDIGPTVALTGLAFDPLSGVLYGVTGGRTTSPPQASLYTIDPFTGAATLVGPEVNGLPIADITFTSDGTFFGWGEGSDDLYTINKSSGVATKVGEANFSTSGSGIAADANDLLYFGGDGPGGDLTIVDRSTGQVSPVAHFSGAPLDTALLNAFAFDANGTLFASNGGDSTPGGVSYLVTVNKTTAAITDLGVTIPKLDAIAFPLPFCDSNPPVITVPNRIVVNKRSRKKHCTTVHFQTSATDPEDGPVATMANPPSGSCFPVGTTTVTVTATDSCGNTATKTFKVRVKKKG